ncbi:MAG TPA: aliphatic sulfonate ABC transporter substrate-binding protein [Abditibacteriaceae bacterium]|jgi:NitT/TauT family transport system substrate-binding protein
MKNLTRRQALNTFVALGASSVFIGALAGCGNNAGTTNNAAENGATSTTATENRTAATNEAKKLTVGYLANIVMPQPLVGFASGDFGKALPGVELAEKIYPAGPEVLEALRAGIIDIAYTGPYPPINAYGKAKDVVLLAGAATGGTEISVRKDAPYKTIADLKGKVIGVNQLGSTVDAMVRFNLINAKLRPGKDVRLIEVKPAEQADALKRKEVDAVAAPAPWPSQVVVNGEGRPLLDWKQIQDGGNYLAGVVFTTKKFAEANPQLVKNFVAAHRTVTDRLNTDREKGNAEVLAAWSKITKKTLKPEVAKAAFATIQFTNEADQKGLERAADIAFQTGIAKKKADLNGFLYQP